MTVRIAIDAAKAACDAITGKIDAESGAAKLVVYSGARPATPAAAITTQVKLIEFEMANPAFGQSAEVGNTATATANSINPTTAIADGTASFFRVLDGAGNTVFDGDVSNTAGSGDLKLSAVAVITGIDVTVVSLSAIQPTGV
ncbi:hypothetical protein WKW50_16470 [Ochrobactrum sp. GPK 3]